MIDENTGEVFTAHTTEKVHFAVVGEGLRGRRLREGGILADVAPTILDIMGVPQPKEMTGKSLLAG